MTMQNDHQPDPTPDPLDEWVAGLLAGTLSNKDQAALAKRLREDPSVRGRYVEHIMLHGMLHWELGSPQRARLLEDRRRAAQSFWRRRGMWMGLSAAAAAALLIIGLPGLWQHDAIPAPTPTLATLHATQSAQWSGLDHDPAIGCAFHKQDLRLASGIAELAFTGGASVILTGPADIELLTPHSARLHNGRMVARASGLAHGFSIAAGTMDIVDQGTEFGVVAGKADVAVDVFEGAVTVGVTGTSAAAIQHLIGGQAIHVAAGTTDLERTAFTSSGFTRAMASALHDPALDTGMVAWWPLNESAGTTAHDASGQGHNGTLLSGTFERDGVTGPFGRALHFDGASTAITFPAQGLFTREMTIQTWMRPEEPQGEDAQIISQMNGFGLAIPRNHLLKFYFWARDASQPYLFTLGRWYHIAVTYDGRQRAFYVNGIRIGAVVSAPPLPSRHEFCIGNLSQRESDYFHGCLEDLRIYGHALTPDEIRLLYLRGCDAHQ